MQLPSFHAVVRLPRSYLRLWSGILAFLPVAVWAFLPITLCAQEGRPDMRFGNITSETFAPTVYTLDSSANAVYLFDRGEIAFNTIASHDEGYHVVYNRHACIRLLHKNAFNLATMVLSTYRKSRTAPVVDNFKAATYNLEEGKVVITKLDKSNIFKEESGELTLEKIIFPNVKEGSVIEYSYDVIYPGYGFIPPWNFQGSYPELWSEYDITVPTLFDYVIEKQGYLRYVVDTSFTSYTNFPISLPGLTFGSTFHGNWHGPVVRRVWAIRDVPAMEKREIYTTTLRNHIAKIEFQLSAIHMSGYEKTYISNWNELTDELMKLEHFGVPLTDRNRWMDDELVKIAGKATDLVAARKIYEYVRDHFDCSNTEGIYISQPLKKTWDDKKGNVADINLLLTALYIRQGIAAAPAILSSRAHGIALDAYPLLKDYNYVITRIRVGEQGYLLDATKPYLGFGLLPELCYNGSARVIDATHDLIPLAPDSLLERRNTIVFLTNDSAGYSGSYQHTAGLFESMQLRERLSKTKPADFFESLRKTMASNKTMQENGFDSVDNREQPVSWHYTMKYNFTQPRVYFNPIMHERFSNNPFGAPERHYPVEMPYRMEHNYTLNMEIPKGYAIESLPKSQRISMEDGSIVFEYMIESDGQHIQFRNTMQIKRTWFPVEAYPGLRDLYTLIVNKEKEQIVFKKIN